MNTPDPSMLLGSLPAGNTSPNASPTDDPTVQMFIKSMANNGVPQPAGPAAMGTPSSTVPPGANSVSPATPSSNVTTAPVAVGNPAATNQPGMLKKMLMGIMYGAGEAMKKQVGLPTDQEIKQQDQADELKAAQTQLAQQKAASQQAADALKAQAADMEDIAPQARALGVTIPEGVNMMVPRNQAGPMLKQIIANQPKDAANVIKGQGLQLNAAKLGYTINPDGTMTPKDNASLSPMQQNGIALNNAQIKLKQAQADLATNPDNPVNKIKLQVAQANMTRADESLKNQEQRTQIARDSLDFRRGQATNFGDPSDANNSYAMLTPHGQTVLQETAPVKEQIVDLMRRMEDEGIDKIQTPGTLAKSRIKYALGFGGPGDELGSDISNLSLAKVTSTARAMKGQRGQRIWAEAEKHTPNLMLDSGWQIHNKLGTLLQMLDRTEQAAVTYERKGGVVPVPTPGTNAMPTVRRRGDTTPVRSTTGERDGW